MPNEVQKSPLKIVLAAVVILATSGWLAYSGVQDNKSYYVTISELQGMGNKAYVRHLRVAGNVAPRQHPPRRHLRGLLPRRAGPQAPGQLQGHRAAAPTPSRTIPQALAVGTFGKDGVFHATQLQAKCASKYAPAKAGDAPAARCCRNALDPLAHLWSRQPNTPLRLSQMSRLQPPSCNPSPALRDLRRVAQRHHQLRRWNLHDDPGRERRGQIHTPPHGRLDSSHPRAVPSRSSVIPPSSSAAASPT